MAQTDPVGLFGGVCDASQVLRQQRVEACDLRRKKCDQCIVRSLGDSGVVGYRAVPRAHTGVTSVTTVYRIHGVEHRNVHNGHRATGTARPKLFAENSGVAGRDRSVIETGGINRDFIPTMQYVERSARRDDRHNRRRSALKTRPEFLIEAIVRPSGKRRVGKREQKKEYGGFFYAVFE